MKLLKFTIFILLNVLLCSTLKAQISAPETVKLVDTGRNNRLTSFKTNSLAELLQASINNGIISSTGSNLSLKATVFGIRQMFDSTVKIDTNYQRLTISRNLEFGAGLNVASTNNAINGFTTSVKYAIINNRDLSRYSIKNFNAKVKAANMDLNTSLYNMVKANPLAKEIENSHKQKLLTDSEYKEITRALIAFTNSQSDGTVSAVNAIDTLKTFLLPFILSKQLNLDTSFFSTYAVQRKIQDSLKNVMVNEISQGGLLTFSFNSDYENKMWDSLMYKLEYIKGLGWQKDSTKPWDIYLGAFFTQKQDTVSKQVLNRQAFTGKLGLNKVLATKRDGSSFLEILGAAEYDYVSKGLYPSEKASSFVADFTITIRLAKSIFLPFELKYDPKNSNLFGFLSVKWDFLSTSSKSN